MGLLVLIGCRKTRVLWDQVVYFRCRLTFVLYVLRVIVRNLPNRCRKRLCGVRREDGFCISWTSTNENLNVDTSFA